MRVTGEKTATVERATVESSGESQVLVSEKMRLFKELGYKKVC